MEAFLRWSPVILLAVGLDLALILWLRNRWQSASLGDDRRAAVRVLGIESPLLTRLRDWPWSATARFWLETMRSWPTTLRAWARAGVIMLKYIWADDWRTLRVCGSLVCLIITTSMGYVYALNGDVSLWLLWAWLACVVVTLYLLWREKWPSVRVERRTLLALASLGLTALALRATYLEIVPGGLHVDEYGVADFSQKFIFHAPGRTYNPFRTGPASHPALYHTLLRVSLDVFGRSITGLRLPSAFAGTLAILATFALVSVFQNVRTAWLTAILLTFYDYHVHWSRIALNNIWDTLWVPATLAAFLFGWKQHWSGGAILSGLAFGLSQYFYQGSKLGIFLLAFVVAATWRATPQTERPGLALYVGQLLLVAAVVAAPLAMFVLRDPGPFFQRPRDILGWEPTDILLALGENASLVDYFWRQLSTSFGAFTLYTEGGGFYGPGVPFLIGLAAPVFLIGCVWAVRERQYLPLLWVVLTTLFGGFFLSAAPTSSHYIVSVPAIVWLTALPLNWLMAQGRPRVAVAVLLIIAASNMVFYFGLYVPNHSLDLALPFPVMAP